MRTTMQRGKGHPDPRAEVHELLIDHLQSVHAAKAGALRMFSPMLDAVRKERSEGELANVDDLLGRMLDAFGQHCQETKRHERLLRERLEALGSGTSPTRRAVLGLAAAARATIGRIGGQNHGRNARDAFIFEHMEIASFELLERLAERAGDRETAELARACREEDEAMAAKIQRNWSNVLSLMLASQGIEGPRREPAEDAREPALNGAGRG